MAIQKRATVYDLEEAELCYAPQYGSSRDPVNVAGFVGANHLRGDVDVAHWEEWRKCRESAPDSLFVIDVRPAKDHAKAPVPGAINIPLGQLREHLDELPKDREIWLHCGVGKTSYYAARILAQHGFRVRNLSGGFASYKAMPAGRET
jgi:rhodanese-related sulfurtransferase